MHIGNEAEKKTLNLKVSIEEAMEILSVAYLKKGLAATINQVTALKSLMDAWKNSNTLSTSTGE